MLINAWDRTLADWLKRGEQATKDYDAVRRNEIDMENGLYRYRVLSVFGSKYALSDDEVVQPADDMGSQVTPCTNEGSPSRVHSTKDWGAGVHGKAHAGTGTGRICRGCMISVLCMGVLCLMPRRRKGNLLVASWAAEG